MPDDKDFKEMSQDELIKMFNQSKGTQQMKDLNMTEAEQNKMLRNFQNPEFVKLFNQFARELQEEQTAKDIDTMLKNAEAMSEAQQTVDSAVNMKQVMQKKELQLALKGKKMTAKERQKVKQQQKAAAELAQEVSAEREKREKQQRFEDLYKRHVDQRKLKQAMTSPTNFSASNSNSNTSNANVPLSDAGSLTAEDYKRMEDLLKQADEFAKAREKTPEQLAKEIAEAAKKRNKVELPEIKETIPLPYKEVFIQDIEYADYLNGEQLNLEKIRGYKAVQLRSGIPDGYVKDSLQLEVTKHEVRLSLEASGKIYKLSKTYQFQLNENTASAKMRLFNEADSKKYGCSQYLELTINIDRNATETIKYYTDLLKERQFVEAGPSILKSPEEVAHEIVSTQNQETSNVEQKPRFELSAELRAKAQEYEKTQNSLNESGEKPAPVRTVERTEDGAKTLDQKYAENLKKQQKTINLDDIQTPVKAENKIFNFIFRNRIFYMQNKDLTWQ